MGKKGMAGQVITGLLVSLGTGMAVTVICTMVIATLISGENIAESGRNVMVTGTLVLSAFIAAQISAGKIKLQRTLMCLAGAGAYFMGLICCGAMFFDGVCANVGVTTLVVAGGGLCAALLGRKQGKTAKYRRPKFPR